ncbi:MAG: hypothetical protein K2L79_03750 [Bacteroidales bacterium]|nr:hypothetical protein [Bacteroidales bacterium]
MDKGVEAVYVLVSEGVCLLREGTAVKPVFQKAADTTEVAVDTTSQVAVEIAEEEMAEAKADTTIVL